MEIYLPEAFAVWLTQYGSFALFALIGLGFLVLPVPQNLTVIFAGILIFHGKLSFLSAFFAAYSGTVIAISLTYIIGKFAGVFLLKKFGRYIGLTASRMQKVDKWYERVGKWTLLIGYYFPVVRRLLGYAAGMANLKWNEFILITLAGAFIWVVSLLSIGYLIGLNLI